MFYNICDYQKSPTKFIRRYKIKEPITIHTLVSLNKDIFDYLTNLHKCYMNNNIYIDRYIYLNFYSCL